MSVKLLTVAVPLPLVLKIISSTFLSKLDTDKNYQFLHLIEQTEYYIAFNQDTKTINTHINKNF